MATQDQAVKDRYRYGLWNRFFFSTVNTRLAKPWTWLFVKLGLTPNQVSYLSLAISLIGMAFIALPGDRTQAAVGGLLLMLGIWWDHSDGQVARITGKGSPGGALLDTVIDRWVESGWLLALGLGIMLADAPQARSYPAWVVASAMAAGVFGNLYLRWANVQKDLYLLRDELMKVRRQPDGSIHLMPGDVKPGPAQVRMFWIPFAFNRDVTFWLLFVITLTPFWVEGLLVFAALHGARGLEKNWYTYTNMLHREERVLANFLDPDYHK